MATRYLLALMLTTSVLLVASCMSATREANAANPLNPFRDANKSSATSATAASYAEAQLEAARAVDTSSGQATDDLSWVTHPNPFRYLDEAVQYPRSAPAPWNEETSTRPSTSRASTLKLMPEFTPATHDDRPSRRASTGETTADPSVKKPAVKELAQASKPAANMQKPDSFLKRLLFGEEPSPVQKPATSQSTQQSPKSPQKSVVARQAPSATANQQSVNRSKSVPQQKSKRVVAQASTNKNQPPKPAVGPSDKPNDAPSPSLLNMLASGFQDTLAEPAATKADRPATANRALKKEATKTGQATNVAAADWPKTIDASVVKAYDFDKNVSAPKTTPLKQSVYEPAPTGLPSSAFNRAPVIFRPAVPTHDSTGHTVLAPRVALATQEGVMASTEVLPTPAEPIIISGPPSGEYLPSETIMAPGAAFENEGSWMSPSCASPVASYSAPGPAEEILCCIRAHLNGPCCPEGLGREFVMHAPFFIDTTQPLKNCRARFDFGWDWQNPDRVEYFWAKTPFGGGPVDPTKIPDGMGGMVASPVRQGEPSVDFQDIRFYIERGTERLSFGTEIPIRVVDPIIRETTAGLGDIKLTNKAVLLDGRKWQLTQFMHTYLPTGSAHRGTGNGHTSLEPGVAWRYKWSDVTYFHGDLSYWFPLGSDPFHSGQVLNYGIALSHVAYDTDNWAIIPTLEFEGWTILDGRQSLANPQLAGSPVAGNTPLDANFPAFEEIDSMGIMNIYPGVRFVCDRGGDCGRFDVGLSGGFAVTHDHWYDGIFRLDLRWSF